MVSLITPASISFHLFSGYKCVDISLSWFEILGEQFDAILADTITYWFGFILRIAFLPFMVHTTENRHNIMCY